MRNAAAKLTDEDVRVIRQMANSRMLPQYMIAQKFGVNAAVVCQVVNRQTWMHVHP